MFISKFTNLLRFIFLLGTFAQVQASLVTDNIERDGKIWRQLNETTNISYYQLDQIYDMNTGLLDTNGTKIGNVNFEGWRIAEINDIASLFSSYDGLIISPNQSFNEIDSSWAPAILEDFTPTGGDNLQNFVAGYTRSPPIPFNDSNSRGAQIVNNFNQIFVDTASTDSEFYKFSSSEVIGVWMYETKLPLPVPLPASLLLMLLGFIALGGGNHVTKTYS